METNMIEDHTAQFRTLLEKSGVSKNSPSAINYYRKTLTLPLQKKILELPVMPKTLEEWYEWATRLDNNYCEMMRIMGWGVEKKKPDNNRKRWMFTQKDPNAMDVDSMSIEEQNELMKKGACFRCKKTEHLSKDCLTRNKVTGTTQEVQKKMTPKEMYKHIQSLTAQLNNGEKMEFFKEAEEEGFWRGEPDRRWSLLLSIFTL